MTGFEATFFGALGGFLPEVFAFYNLRHSSDKPFWIKSWFYWIVTAIMIILSGAITYIYNTYTEIHLNAIMAIHLGAATPLIIQTMLKEKPKIS